MMDVNTLTRIFYQSKKITSNVLRIEEIQTVHFFSSKDDFFCYARFSFAMFHLVSFFPYSYSSYPPKNCNGQTNKNSTKTDGIIFT